MSDPNGFDHLDRLVRVRVAMSENDIDALLLSVGADLPYLTGYEAMPLERLTMAVIRRHGEPVLVVPELEAPRVERKPGVFSVRAWGETEDPLRIVADAMGEARRAAIGEATWSRFLLALQTLRPEVEFETAGPLVASLRVCKDPREIELLRRAGAAADRVVERLRDEPFGGRSERELAQATAAMTVEEGHDSAAFTIVAAGPNGASPHHEAGDRVIEAGDAVIIDFGGRVGSYCSDTTRCFHVGPPTAAYAEAYEVLGIAQQAAVEAVLPGIEAQAIDRAARRVISDAGYGDFFIHRTGHGIGLDLHEEPNIVEGNDLALAEGMTFSIEPGIYIPGEFGMRIEDIVVVGAGGAVRLNRSSRDLAIVE